MKNGRHEKDGNIYHFQDDQYHREGGPAIECPNGSKSWWKHGELHREDGPAVEYENGQKEWWINGLRHREDGPAIDSDNGNEWWPKEWYLEGNQLTEEQFNHWRTTKTFFEKLDSKLPEKNHNKKNKI